MVVIVLAVDMWEGYFDASVAVADDAAENIVAAEMVLFAFAVAFVDNCVAAAAAEFDVVAIYPDAVAAERALLAIALAFVDNRVAAVAAVASFDAAAIYSDVVAAEFAVL